MSVGVRSRLFAARNMSLPCSRLDVQLLDAIERCGDIGEVGRRVGLRTSALERHLDRLDRSGGVPLTSRGHGVVRLTSAGSRMLAACYRFYRQVDAAVRTHILGLGLDASELPNILAVAHSDAMLEELVEDVAVRLGVLLSLTTTAPDQALQYLAGYRVDAAYTWWMDDPRMAVDRPLRVFEVVRDPLCVILNRDHPLAGRVELSLADLLGVPWVSEVGPTSEVLVSQVFHAAGLPAPPQVHVTSASVGRGLLCRGGVVGFSSGALPAPEAPLVRRPVVEQPYRHTGLLVDSTVVPSAFALDLAAMLAARHTARAHRRRGHPIEVTVPDTPTPPSPRSGDESNGERASAPGELDNDDLQLLRAVAEHGSINRAATVLSLSQPALTRRVGRLEHRLGARLFVRTAQGTRLTGPVQQFLRRLAELEDELGTMAHRGIYRPDVPMRRSPPAG